MMKNIRAGSSRKILSVALTVILITVLSACLAICASAESGVPEGTALGYSFAAESGIAKNDEGIYAKTYDGTAEINPAHVTLTVEGQTDTKKPTDITACFVSPSKTEKQASVGVGFIRITYKWEGVEQTPLYIDARINTKNLSWKGDPLSVALVFDPENNTGEYRYELSGEELAAVKVSALEGVASADLEELAILSVGDLRIGVDEFNRALREGKKLVKPVSVTLKGDCSINYTCDNFEVTVVPTPVEIGEVTWYVDGEEASGALEFAYGDKASRLITAVGKIGEDSSVDLVVGIEGSDLSLALAEDEVYGAVREEAYVLYAAGANSVFYVLKEESKVEVTFQKAVCEIEVSDCVFDADADHKPVFYPIPVSLPEGAIPASVLARIKCEYTSDGKTVTDAPSLPGTYTVQFLLDEEDAKNYTLKVIEKGEDADGEITMKILPYSLTVGFEDGRADVLVFCEKGSLEGVEATVEELEPDAALLRSFTVYEAFTLSLKNVKKGDSFKLLIPVNSSLFSDANTHALSDADLYLIDGDELVSVKDVYTVTLSEDGAYYVVEGVAAEGEELSFAMLVAPLYNVSFWATVPGVALIILLVLLAVLALALIGLALLRVEKREKNPTLTIDTEGDVPKVVPGVAPDQLGSADECIGENLDQLESSLREEVDPEAENAPDIGDDAETMASDMVQDTVDEAAAMSLTDDRDAEDIAEIERMTEAMAEDRAQELSETVDALEAVAEEADVASAVDEAIEEAVNEDSVDAFAEMPVDATLDRLGETVDAIVVEALSELVEIPDGLLNAELPNPSSKGEDVHARAKATAREALRVVSVDGTWTVKEGHTKADMAGIVSDAAKKCIPEDWEDARKDEVIDEVTKVLTEIIFG